VDVAYSISLLYYTCPTAVKRMYKHSRELAHTKMVKEV